jgi:magnesium chelatase family protein
LPATIWAKERGFKRIFIPKDNVLESSIIPWIDVIPVSTLEEVIDILNKDSELQVAEKLDFKKFWESDLVLDNKFDFKYILGQEHAKRALEIAASWWHNIIMDGPPWSWKTMLSRSFASILPDLTIDEAIEVSKIYSISWLLNTKTPIISKRPFRTIHHTASSASIIWWWRNAKPWEISLAHKWVLFLDEILEFDKSVLEVLRQPLEDWNITVNRVNATYNYPAAFTLVWAMNPCPCWFLTDPDKECICSNKQIENYRWKLSWPLVDRVDIFIEVPKVKTKQFKIWEDYWDSESSECIKKRVEKARFIQLKRFKWTNITFNSEMWTKEINKYCKIDNETDNILKQAVTNLNLSARAYYRILKLSRTISDLEWEENINSKHILEALSFRKKDES